MSSATRRDACVVEARHSSLCTEPRTRIRSRLCSSVSRVRSIMFITRQNLTRAHGKVKYGMRTDSALPSSAARYVEQKNGARATQDMSR